MAGQGGLDGDPGRLDVADLADQDHVGVLAQDGLEPGGEGEPGLVVGLDLVDRREDVLDRVLDGHDVEGRVVDLAQGGVEGGGLAAARRAGAQHHAEGGPDDLGVLGRGCRPASRSSRRRTERVLSRIRMTHFSPQMVAVVATRTSISLPSTVVRELAVLGAAPLDDVHARHDLDATDQAQAHGGREDQDLFQGAVDAEPHPDDVFGRFDVDVGGAVAHGLGQDAVDHLDHRGVVGHHHRRRRGSTARLREPSTTSKAWTSWATPPMAR